jgi:hypothetical protein
MKTCWGSGGISPQFSGHYMEVSGQLRAPAALLYRRLHGPQNQFGDCDVEKNILLRSSLYRLSYPGSR